MIKLSPSLLAADVLSLGEEVRSAEACGCDELHFDVMDGCFVPNLSFGPHILKGIRGTVNLPLDVHLMLRSPLPLLSAFRDAGANGITVHLEAEQPEACLRQIREWGLCAGLSLKPATPVQDAVPLLPLCGRILLMTVEPGFGGQRLMPEVLEKAVWLRQHGFTGDIEADGGITAENADRLTAAGINVLVLGTGFFRSPDRAAVVQRIHTL